MNRAKLASSADGYRFLREAFVAEQNALKSRLELANCSITHSGELGAVNERSFIEFLRDNLPQRYAVNSAIVINSEGRSSDQIDVVIHDPFYSPTLLLQHDRSFVPVESVYAVFEIKPEINKQYLEYSSLKAASVRALMPKTGRFNTINGMRTVGPLNIVSGLIAIAAGWKDGVNSNSFTNCMHKYSAGDGRLDCGVAVSGDYFNMWETEGSLSVMRGENSLAFFIFGLLEILQRMGNAPGVDWSSYKKALMDVSN